MGSRRKNKMSRNEPTARRARKPASAARRPAISLSSPASTALPLKNFGTYEAVAKLPKEGNPQSRSTRQHQKPCMAGHLASHARLFVKSSTASRGKLEDQARARMP